MKKYLSLLYKYKATIGYILCIYLVNAFITILPQRMLWGQAFSLGDFTVGSIYLMRDLAQREIKHYVIIAMIIGGILSYAFSDPTVAIASVSAFITGELIDFTIYTYTKKPLSQRLIWSSMISCPIDSFVFLALTDQFNSAGMAVMLLAKAFGVMTIWCLWRVKNRKSLVPSSETPNNVSIELTGG